MIPRSLRRHCRDPLNWVIAAGSMAAGFFAVYLVNLIS